MATDDEGRKEEGSKLAVYSLSSLPTDACQKLPPGSSSRGFSFPSFPIFREKRVGKLFVASPSSSFGEGATANPHLSSLSRRLL